MKNLRKLRRAADLTLQQVAEAIGVSYMTYWRWEHGEAEPGAKYVVPIANLFGVTCDELLKED